MRRAIQIAVVLGMIGLVLAGCPSKTEPTVDAGAGAGAAQAAGPAPSPALKELAEVEPNEKTDQAMELQESCVVAATLEAAAGPKDRATDWYKLAPAARKVARIAVSGIPGEDLRLKFLDADRNDLFVSGSGEVGEPEGYPNLTLDRAIFLAVQGAAGGKGGPYKLEVRLSDPAPGEEVEFNGRYSVATEIRVGASVLGYLGDRGDEDWYLLPLKDVPAGSILRVDLTEVEGVRATLMVADRETRATLLEQTGELNKGLVIRNLGLPGSPEAVYLVVKSGWVPGAQPKKFVQTFNPAAPYSLSVSSEAGGDDLEREPNDSAEKATAVLDGQKIRAYLSTPNDADWFKITVLRPSLLAAELSALPRVDLKLIVVDPARKGEKKDNDLLTINDGAVNEPEILTNCVLGPGENFLRVEGAYKNVDGKWIRDIANLDDTYTLTLSLRTDEGREEREPNQKPEQATPVKVGDSLRGTLHPKGDVDLFRLDLSAQEGPHETVIECTGIPKLDISISLQTLQVDEQGKREILASSASGQGEAKEEIRKELLPGEYLIQVQGAPRSESNTRDTYLLTVTQP